MIDLDKESQELIEELILAEFTKSLEDTKFCSIGRKRIIRDTAIDLGLLIDIIQIEEDYNFEKTKEK